MKAWTIDASSIDLGEINTKELGNVMVATKAITEFLSMDSNKMFIVAPKGLGKTYLLKIKSQLFRDKESGFKFIPSNTLCERFVSNEISFSDKELIKFNERAVWKKTWELCLYTLILRSFKSDSIPKELIDVIGENTGSLGEILGMFLQHRGQIERLHSYVASDLKPAIRNLKDNSSANQIAIFIDNVDEAFDNYVGFEAERDGNIISANLWINAQLSLLSVSKDVCSINNHIKIYLTIRSEAYNNFNDPQKLQIDSYCLFLQYTKNEIKEIFIKNILLMSKDDLTFPSDPDKIRGFLGYSTIPHKFIEDIDGKKKEEDFFNFIYRHTYARPREIVCMGAALSKIGKKELKNYEIVGSAVNTVSYSLFDQLTNEIIPVFEKGIFELFCKEVISNVISFDEYKSIDEKIKIETNFEHAFSYFYRLGLIGTVQNEFAETNQPNGVLKQSFLRVGEYTLSDSKVPECQYYVLHPSLNKKMKQLHGINFYDRFNILGYDYEFNPEMQKIRDFHMHFGLDRDSISILLPEIDSTKCIAVVSSIGSSWTDISNSDLVRLKINEQSYEFKVYRESLSSEKKEEIYANWKKKKYHVLLYTTSIESIQKYFDNVTTASFCFYEPIKSNLLKLLKSKNKSLKHFYYCVREYMSSEIPKIKKALSLKENNIYIDPLLIDRYQFEENHLYNKEERILNVVINAEQNCRLICPDRPNSSVKSTDTIIRTTTDISFRLLYKKQNLLNEGIYQFVKLLNEKNQIVTGEDILLDIFVHIQVNRIINELSENQLHELFDGNTRSLVINDLKNECKIIIERVLKISSKFVYSNRLNIVTINKSKGIFPTNSNVYEYIRSQNDFFKKSHPFTSFLTLLDVKPQKDVFHNLFISYSYKDREIATDIYDRLTLMGIHVTMYEKDDPSGFLEKYMSESVSRSKRLLFIASENSLKSDACHFELSKCFEQMQRENDDSKLTAIRLDNYVLDLTLLTNQMVSEDRKKNIKGLQRINVNKLIDLENISKESPNYLKSLDERLYRLAHQSYLINPKF